MKLQPRKTNTRPPARRRSGKEQKSLAAKLYVLFYLLMMFSVLFAAANYRIDLNRKISNMERAYNRTQQEIFELDRDIQALKVSRQHLYGWSNISSRIAEHRLPLRHSEHQQIRYFTVKRSPRPALNTITRTAHNQLGH